MRHVCAAMLAAVLWTGGAAADEHEPIELAVAVERYLSVEVVDPDVHLYGARAPDGIISSMDMVGTEARAEFRVTADADYSLQVTVPETWVHGSGPDRLVKFTSAKRNFFIGGSIFLDLDPTDRQLGAGSDGIVPWDGGLGQVNAGPFMPGAHLFGLGVLFDITKWRKKNKTGDEPGFAKTGTYSTTATVTASTY